MPDNLFNRIRQALRRHPRARRVALFLYAELVALAALPTACRRWLFKILVDRGVYPRHWGCRTGARLDPVVCSLTSYGRRVSLAHYTVASLLMQRCKPDEVVLWLDQDHWSTANLPPALRRLEKYGLTVRFCADLKSYKKLLPALADTPDKVVVTCDDDMFYPPDWLEGLWQAHQRQPNCVFCYRGDRLAKLPSGELAPYANWDFDTWDEEASHAILPIGCRGILYPPGALAADVQNWEAIKELCPTCDDLWFWAMSVRNDVPKAVVLRRGWLGRRARPRIYELYDTSSDKLANKNVLAGGNDTAMRAVMLRYELTTRLAEEA